MITKHPFTSTTNNNYSTSNKFNTKTLQIQYKFNTNSLQKHYKFNTNSIQQKNSIQIHYKNITISLQNKSTQTSLLFLSSLASSYLTPPYPPTQFIDVSLLSGDKLIVFDLSLCASACVCVRLCVSVCVVAKKFCICVCCSEKILYLCEFGFDLDLIWICNVFV